MSGMVASALESITRDWDQKFAGPALEQLFKDASERIPKGGRVLDAGCGTGLRFPQIHSAFEPASLTALDKSRVILERAREQKPGAFFTTGDICDLPFENETFDVVVSTWVIETLPDPKRAVQECLRVLKTGGILAYCFVNLPPGFKPGDRLLPPVLHALDAATREQERLGTKPGAFNDSPFAGIQRHLNGLISTVILGKCCQVGPHMLPIQKLGRISRDVVSFEAS